MSNQANQFSTPSKIRRSQFCEIVIANGESEHVRCGGSPTVKKMRARRARLMKR